MYTCLAAFLLLVLYIMLMKAYSISDRRFISHPGKKAERKRFLSKMLEHNTCVQHIYTHGDHIILLSMQHYCRVTAYTIQYRHLAKAVTSQMFVSTH